ncbi:MAG: right-handed parallel beta-helix repeat-containing protein [Bacteroidales bacterium]|nr:right-handed parallel beta-helix repeat-containing protein [Bacteroidales bacterium]
MKKRIYEILIIFILIALVIGFLFVHKSQKLKNKELYELEFFCDFEQQNENLDFITTHPNNNLTSGEISTDIFFEGQQSLLIPAWKEFQHVINLNNLGPNLYITISFLRNKSSNTAIVAQGINDGTFYHRTDIPLSNNNEIWEEVALRFTTGSDFDDTLNVYFYNPQLTTTYIDNLSIKISEESFYPEYDTLKPLLIYIEGNLLKKLTKKRQQALQKGVLVTEEDSWVSAIVYGDEKMMDAEIRLKGDWLDHLKGDKWSYRIKLSDDSWQGMRVFSIQTPFARGFLNEWLIHKTCKDEDILTTKYGFVPVYLNGKSIGLYSYEEHFQKELIESSKRREGPIIKFSETDFWEFTHKGIPNKLTYNTSVIEPFGTEKTLRDTVKYNQFLIANNLLNLYRTMGAKASDIFDVKKLAKFIAFTNARNCFHALEWHNARYYYNPVLCRIEPIGFDMFAGTNEYTKDNPLSPMIEHNHTISVLHSLNYLMIDSVFENEYLKYIDVFTTKKDYNYFRQKYSTDYQYYDSLHRTEFMPYYFDTLQFDRVVNKINKYLPLFKDSLKKHSYRQRYQDLNKNQFYHHRITELEQVAHTYLKCYQQSASSLHIKCFLQNNVNIIGLGNNDKIEIETNHHILNSDSNNVKNETFNFDIDLNNFDQVFFKLENIDQTYITEIVHWPAPTSYNPRNDIAQNSTDISKYINYEKQEVHFKGDIVFDNHVYTPIGYDVYFEAGTTIDLINKSAMIINSTVSMNGTKENPIKIFSSDKTANGFTVLQAEGKSIVNFVIFDNLNTLNYNWWTLTGAVNFYESDVEFYNCTFTNNHCEDMLNTIRCDFLVKDCLLQNTFGDSHDSDFCTGTLDNCMFLYNGNDAIDFSTSDVIIKNCTIRHSLDKAISIGENTKAVIENVIIEDAGIGIASKDLSHADINGCKISNATYGFVLLQKKPEFGPASITATNCKLNNIWKEHIIEVKSVLILNGKHIKGKQQKLRALFYE